MSFATLEEAWGMTPGGFDQGFDQPSRVEVQRTPFSRLPRPRAAAADGPFDQPSSEDRQDAEVQGVRRFLARSYARYGAAGIARLLPPEAAAETQSLLMARRHHKGRRRRWCLKKMLRKLLQPEVLLLLLVAAFVAFVAWDWASSRAVVQPTMYAPPPFSMMTSSA